MATSVPERGEQAGQDRLREGVLTVPDVVFTSVANQAPGAAVSLNFFFAILFAGAAFPFAMLVALVATLFLANTLSQFSRHLSSSAGFGTFASRGLGARFGFFTAWCALFYGLLFPAEVVVLISQVVSDQFGGAIPWQIVDAALIGVIWYVAYTGVKRSARVAIIFGAIEVAVFLVLGLVLVFRAGDANTFEVFTPTTGAFGLAWGLIYAFLSFTGFESVASLAEETKDPKRNVGRSAFLALLAVGIFYIFLAYAGVVGWGVDRVTGGEGPSFLSNDPFAYGTLAERIWPPFLWIILFAVLNSAIACALAAMNFTARYLYSLGRMQVLPTAFGRVHPEHRTPAYAIHVMAVVSLVLSLGLGSWWGPPIAFAFMATAFTYGWILMFTCANVALPFFYRREHPDEYSVAKHVVFPVIGTVALLPALLAPLLPLIPAFSEAGPVAWQLIATVPLTLAWAIVGVVLARVMGQTRARNIAQIGDDQVALEASAPERPSRATAT